MSLECSVVIGIKLEDIEWIETPTNLVKDAARKYEIEGYFGTYSKKFLAGSRLLTEEEKQTYLR